MALNFIAILLCGLVPILTGFFWYNPKTFGNVWMKAAGVNPEDGKKMNMGLTFGLTYVFGVMLATMMYPLVIHQMNVYSILVNTPGFGQEGSEVMNFLEDFMAKYGGNFRTFKHGAFHGAIAGLFFGLPIIATNALFEMKGFKYIAVNAGFWIVNLAIIGGIICAYG